VCPEAIDLLKDKPVPLSAFALFRRMQPLRQIAAAEMMVGMDRYSKGYAQALLAATPAAQLVADGLPKSIKGLSTEQMALMERETAQLDREIKIAEQSYGPNHLQLVLARGYVAKLLVNPRVSHWLEQRQPEVHAEFKRLAEADGIAA
jgi:nucleotide-binding universal stress UspA family protein